MMDDVWQCGRNSDCTLEALPPLHRGGLVGHVHHLSITYSFSLPKDPLIITGFPHTLEMWVLIHSPLLGPENQRRLLHAKWMLGGG